MDDRLTYFATCPKGVESLLAEELRAIGVRSVRPQRAGVAFMGPLETGYRACLWSRIATRVLMRLTEFPAPTPVALYEGVRAIAWEEHLDVDGTLAVDAVSTSSAITHTQFAALKTKDAIVDRFRDLTGKRPSVDVERPSIRVNVSIRRDRATISLDLSGESLHRRGYREPGVQAEAPLKENLAAAVLQFAGWPEVAEQGGALFDPMCGSGTLLIEGAMMAADIAPGMLREYFGFLGWRGHQPAIWMRLTGDAERRREEGLRRPLSIAGSDRDGRAIGLTLANARRAGLGDLLQAEQREIVDALPPHDAQPGLVLTNPPYGERLGRAEDLGALYTLLGVQLREAFPGWRAAVLTSEPSLAACLGIRPTETHAVWNGRIETHLYVFKTASEAPRMEPHCAERGAAGARRAPLQPRSGEASARSVPAAPRSSGAEMFANRLRKNVKTLGKWARRDAVSCYRLYDADMPEYAVAIDLYAGAVADEGQLWAHIQEYAPPMSIDPAAAQARLADVMGVLPEVLGIPAERAILKVRKRQRGTAQYERRATLGKFLEVSEGGLRFLVNLVDYLDTGLFLDHRLTRAMLKREALGARFLNLFAYTGTASVYAAAGGATSTTTVDLSTTYLAWAGRNLELNSYSGSAHQLVRADVLEWIAEEGARVSAGTSKPYDLVFLDPPTFSNSKRMKDRTFDVQRDHTWLLRETSRLLSANGVLVFSNNARKFKMDFEALPDLEIADITAETIPPDFARNPKIHNCWVIRRPG